ncbi:MAG: helix-turn-helix domain-containing protein [Streptosporangiaceae bacterium]
MHRRCIERDQLLKPADTADTLAVSARTVENFAHRGLLTKVYLGRAVRYRLSEVQRIIAQGGVR